MHAGDDEVEAAFVLAHLIGISRNNHVIRAETKRVFFLVRRSSKDDDMRTKSISDLHTHVAQTT